MLGETGKEFTVPAGGREEEAGKTGEEEIRRSTEEGIFKIKEEGELLL